MAKGQLLVAVAAVTLVAAVLVGSVANSRRETRRPEPARPARAALANAREGPGRSAHDLSKLRPDDSGSVREILPPALAVPTGELEAQGPAQAVRWLMKVQNAAGSWGTDRTALGGREIDRVGITALALLPFLGAGYTPLSQESLGGLKTGDSIEKAIRWLRDNQLENGRFSTQGDPVLSQALGALALGEAYGMTGSASLKESAQRALAALEGLQQQDGSWGDLDQSLWASLAIKSGQLGGSPVGEDGLARAKDYFKRQLDAGPNLPAMISYLFFNREKANPVLAQTSAWILSTPPDPGEKNFAYGYLGSLALYQYDGPGGDLWKCWDGRLRAMMAGLQDREGQWPATTPDQTLVRTSLASLVLEISGRATK